jgi:hypothetical protein
VSGLTFTPYQEGAAAALSDRDLDRLERRLQLRLPAEYRAFLGRTNGGKPSRGCFRYRAGPYGDAKVRYFYSDHAGRGSLERARSILQPPGYERIPRHLLAIAADAFGNQIVLETDGDRAGSIWFWDHETGDLHFVASTLQQFLDRLDADGGGP